jgi:hypothetical protein
LHLKTRKAAIPMPFRGPYFSIAAAEYSEQLGWYLQEHPNRGEISLLYADMAIMIVLFTKTHLQALKVCDSHYFRASPA